MVETGWDRDRGGAGDGHAGPAVFNEALELGDLRVEVEADAVVVLLDGGRDLELHANVAGRELLRGAGGDGDTRGTGAGGGGADLALDLAVALRETQFLRDRDVGRVAGEHGEFRGAEQLGALFLREGADGSADIELADEAEDGAQCVGGGGELHAAGDVGRGDRHAELASGLVGIGLGERDTGILDHQCVGVGGRGEGAHERAGDSSAGVDLLRVENLPAIGVEDGRTGRRVHPRNAAPVHVPSDSKLLERALLHLHELGLDLDLPHVVVTGEDVADLLVVAGGLGDDDRGSVVSERAAFDGEAYAGLLEKRLHRGSLPAQHGCLRRRGLPRGSSVADRRGGHAGHTKHRGARDREKLGLERGSLAARPHHDRVGLHLVLVAHALGDEVEHALQRGVAQGEADQRVFATGINQDDVHSLATLPRAVVLLGDGAERGDHVADRSARPADRGQNDFAELAGERRDGGGRIGLAGPLLIDAGPLPALRDLLEHLGSGLLPVKRTGLGFFLGDAEQEALGHGIIRLLRLDGPEGFLGAINVAGHVLGAAFGDQLRGRGAIGREGDIGARASDLALQGAGT